MPISVTVKGKTYESDGHYHAEEIMLASVSSTANLVVEMNGWPCTGERYHDCHKRFLTASASRTITVTITDDHAGYAANHGRKFGEKGTITYANGVATYG
ncbi:hypothetical protein WME73_10400 [Sorangium sp. So ce302]|uniref:hypothetical protein n=1 Tax=unclassified Sorangium TaxID=2621164 RepID=UPI003F5EEE3D